MEGKMTYRPKAEFEDLPPVDPREVMIALAKGGLINDEIAEFFGMTPSQFKLILEKNPELKDALDEAKDVPNFKVEQALFKRALGYPVRETVQEDGRPVKVTLKEIAPDPISCIFWLKNRDPKRWRDVIEHKFSLRDRMDRAHDAISSPNRPKELPKASD
jgi:hypothetical protein